MEYQQRGRYQTVGAQGLVFSRKKMKLEHQYSVSGDVASDVEYPPPNDDVMEYNPPEAVGVQLMETDTMSKTKSKQKAKIDKEKVKISSAVKSLTIDPNQKLDHKQSLITSARKLNLARLPNQTQINQFDLQMLKSELFHAQDESHMARILWKVPYFQAKFSNLLNSSYLEQLLSLGSAPECPLQNFPPDINRNLYSDIIDLALTQAPDFLLLIINLCIKRESPIQEKDVIQIAYLFAQFASSVSSKNNVLKKIKSISMKCNGLTNEGLDAMAAVGAGETSRTFRNDRDFMASIADEILKCYAKTMTAQFCFDNLDLMLNHRMHNLTLNYREFEPSDTSALSISDSKSFHGMKNLFSLETVLMQSDENKDLLEHYKNVVANTLGRLFGDEIPEVRWMLTVFPKHYSHPNSSTAGRKSLIHVDKPMYLQEIKNRLVFKQDYFSEIKIKNSD